MINPDRVLKTIAAIEAGDAKTVRMMLKVGVPASHLVTGTSDSDRCSLANYAAKFGQFEIFELLIAAGASIDEMEQSSWCPPISMLECACSAKVPSLEIVRKILKEGNATQGSLNQSLLLASYGQGSIVTELLSAGANPNYSDPNLDTPLIVAVLCDQEDIAIRLVEAGADPNVVIRNKERAPFWKKTIQDAMSQKGMHTLLSLVQPAGGETKIRSRAKSVPKPKTIEACWGSIDAWLASNAPEIQLPKPRDWAPSQPEIELLTHPAAEQTRLSLSCHDGTGDFSIIAMPEDSSYAILSVEDALSIRKTMREVYESERTNPDSTWWSEFWWPIAENGGGDLLVVECAEGTLAGQVLKFSHETRRSSRYKKSILELLQDIAIDLQNGNLSLDRDKTGLE